MVQRREFALGDPSAGGLPAALAELAVLVGEHDAGRASASSGDLRPKGILLRLLTLLVILQMEGWSLGFCFAFYFG